MRTLLNGWTMIAAAALAVVAAGGVLLHAGTPDQADPALSSAEAPAGAAPKVPAARPEPAPAAKPSPKPEPDERFVIKRILPIDGPIKYGEWHWDEAGVPAGPLVITVDLDARVLSVFRGGYEIGATAVLLGTEEKPTPTGVFPITQKRRHHVSNLYNAPMPYMQRLTNDGISLHASEVEWGYASHGCIGMPETFAARLFGLTKVGDKVYITRGKQIGMGDSLTGA